MPNAVPEVLILLADQMASFVRHPVGACRWRVLPGWGSLAAVTGSRLPHPTYWVGAVFVSGHSPLKLAKRPAFVQVGGMTQRQTQAESWTVIGAGAIGLSLARRLADAGRAVTVYERDGHLGGQAASFKIEPGVRLERFYHHAFKSDHILRRTYDALGLAAGLTWTHPLTATLLQGESQPLDCAVSLLKFEHLRRLDRLRMGRRLRRCASCPEAIFSRAVRPAAGFDAGWAAHPINRSGARSSRASSGPRPRTLLCRGSGRGSTIGPPCWVTRWEGSSLSTRLLPMGSGPPAEQSS